MFEHGQDPARKRLPRGPDRTRQQARAITLWATLAAILTLPTSAAAEPDELLFENLPALELPTIEPGLLAKGHSFRLLDGGLSWLASGRANDENEQNDLNFLTLSVNTRYFASLEAREYGYSVLSFASEALNRSPASDGSQFDNYLHLDTVPEGRYYLTPDGLPFFIYGAGELDLAIQTTKITGRFATDADSIATGRIGLAFGVGYGRVLAIDPAVRLRRLEEALQREGVISGAIPDDVGSDIIRTWYALRNHLGNYPRLAYTMKHLAEAGMLSSKPNLRATYKAIAILQDPFIFDRRRGHEARIGLGVVKPLIGFDEAVAPDASLAVVGSAQYEKPISTTRQLSVRGQLFADLGDVTTDNREWSLRASVNHTRAYYNHTYDPIGSLTVSAEAGISGLRSLASNGPRAGVDLVANARYSRMLNRGSLATLGGSLSLRNDGEFIFGINVGFSRGIADGFYSPYSSGSLAP